MKYEVMHRMKYYIILIFSTYRDIPIIIRKLLIHNIMLLIKDWKWSTIFCFSVFQFIWFRLPNWLYIANWQYQIKQSRCVNTLKIEKVTFNSIFNTHLKYKYPFTIRFWCNFVDYSFYVLILWFWFLKPV